LTIFVPFRAGFDARHLFGKMANKRFPDYAP